jgi:hypothetical protein
MKIAFCREEKERNSQQSGSQETPTLMVVFLRTRAVYLEERVSIRYCYFSVDLKRENGIRS